MLNRISEDTRSSELSRQNSVVLLAGHMIKKLARKNFKTRGSAIAASNSTTIERAFELSDNYHLYSKFYDMGVTLPEETSSQSGILSELDPPVPEFNSNSVN